MTKTFEPENISSIDENVRVKITETKDVESFVSIAELKQRHARLLERIEIQKAEADLIVDQIKEIDTNTDITVEDIPVKVSVIKEVIAK